MKIAAAELASIAERRIERLVNPYLNEGCRRSSLPVLDSTPGS